MHATISKGNLGIQLLINFYKVKSISKFVKPVMLRPYNGEMVWNSSNNDSVK